MPWHWSWSFACAETLVTGSGGVAITAISRNTVCMRVSMDLSVDWSKKVRRVATRFYSWLETILFHLALTILAWSMA